VLQETRSFEAQQGKTRDGARLMMTAFDEEGACHRTEGSIF
jgi:hypothetical protein